MNAIIYCITNLVNNKRYVGVTRFKLQTRFTQHVYKAKKPKTWLHKAINKYGADKFKIEQIASCVGDWSEVEQLVIKSLNPEYNMTNGGEITVGKRVPPEIVEIIKNKNTGKKRTPEQCKAMSELKTQQMQDPELKAKCVAALRLAHARRHEFEDKRVDSIRRAAAEGKMARPMTEERKARQLENITTPAARAKMAASKRKKVLCIDTGVVYNSLVEAGVKTGIPFSSISYVCLGKRNSVHNHVFKYI